MKNKQENKEFVKNWARAESLSLEIYQEIANISDVTGPTDNKNEFKKYLKLSKKINNLFNINNLIIKSLQKPEKLKDDEKLIKLKKKYNKKQKEIEKLLENQTIGINYPEKMLEEKRKELYNIELKITKLDDKWSIY